MRSSPSPSSVRIPVLEMLKCINRLGPKKWNFRAVNKRTLRRWFGGDAVPSVAALKAVAEEIWDSMCSTGHHALREAVFSCIRLQVPTAPCASWSRETFLAWFVGLLEPTVEPPRLTVDLDVQVWIPDRGGFVSLREPGVAPVKRDARVRLRAIATPPAYLHLFWIASTGQVTPLHPWEPDDWSTIGPYAPKDADPLPTGSPGYWTIDTPEGLESVVVAAHWQPLDVAILRTLRGAWEGLAARVPFRQLVPGAPFEWQGPPGAFRLHVKPNEDDPVLLRHQTVAERLALHFPYVKIVSFANRG